MPAIIAALIGAGSGIGSGLLGSIFNKKPKQPNLATQGGKLAAAEAELLPLLLQQEVGMQTGQPLAALPGYAQATFTQEQANQWTGRLNSELKAAQAEPDTIKGPGGTTMPNAAKQNKIQGIQAQLAAIPAGGGKVFVNKQGQPVPQNVAMPSLPGTSTADIQGTLLNQLNKGKLATEAQFDPQFIQTALNELNQADPQFQAARNTAAGLIENQIANPVSSPVANTMQQQVQERMNAGQGLTPEEEQMLNQAVAQSQSAQGTPGSTGPDFSRDMTTGLAGTQRGISNAGAGLAELESGQTPADIAARSLQQNIHNLQAFENGPTPESMFSYLTGAGQGATPYAGTPNLSQSNQNAAAQGQTAAANQYSAEVGRALSSPNPWLQGISSLISGGSALAGGL